MFEKLVVSNAQRRRHTTAKFFLGTAALYALTLGCAFVVSVLVSDPRLADTTNQIILVGRPLLSGGTPPITHTTRHPSQRDTPPDPYHPMTLENLMSHQSSRPPHITIDDVGPDNSGLAILGGPQGAGPGIGIPNGIPNTEPAPRPDPTTVKPAVAPITTVSKPVRLTSTVLQGKAIERRTPIYPPLARQIHLYGEVSVEVIISPDGRVETARVVSGHPLLSQYAREAALGWRFEPTLLNNVPVRVTGVIVFVFKLTE